LNFEASFFPTLALAKKATKEELEAKAKEEADAAVTDDEKKTKEETPAVETIVEPTGPPVQDLHGHMIRYTEDKKINLLSYESGVLTVKIHEVILPTRAHAVAEVLVDSNDAQFRTTDLNGNVLTFQESGDAFVKEMDFSRLVIRIRDAKSKNENERLGFWTSRVQDTVKSIQNRPITEEGQQETDDIQEYNLLDCPGGKIRVSFKFLPVVQFKLDPSESLESRFCFCMILLHSLLTNIGYRPR
jgi:Ca2+-dependent lipid-binding protein